MDAVLRNPQRQTDEWLMVKGSVSRLDECLVLRLHKSLSAGKSGFDAALSALVWRGR